MADDIPCCVTKFWLFLLIVIGLVTFAGLMAGLTLGLMSLGLVDLEVLIKSGRPQDRIHAAKIFPVVKNQHLLLCTLLIGNSLAMESLPIFLDKLVPPWAAVLLSVTLILMFGEILPQAICTRYGLTVGATLAPFVQFLLWLFFPVAYPISKVLDWMLGKGHAALLRRAELKTFVDFHGNEKWGLHGKTDPESFAECVPLATHSDLEPYIQRIVDGDVSPILTGKPIKTISLSSGTTQGKPKFVPFNDELVESTMQIFKTSFAFRNREFPIRNGKALQFIYSSKQFKTKGGLPAGTATTNVFRSSQFKKTMKVMHALSCSPDEVIFGPDYHQSLYCHLLCGLIFRDDIQVVSSTFAHSIVYAFKTFEQVCEELCTDIREGVLSSRVTVPSIRTAMAKLLKPNPDLADMVYEKCCGLSNWYGLIPELFPNAKYIYGIMTGSMEPYLKKLRHYAADLPLLSADYGSSEGWIGANVNPKLPPESATFAVLPNIGYFEFIPLRENLDFLAQDKNDSTFHFLEPKPVSMTEVKVGEEYEIIVTNFAGLYRYRLGDVVKVMGFHNSTPELQFVCRRNLLLTINIDKNTEKDLQLSVEAAAAAEKLEVVDFTSRVDLSTDPGHYVIFWEINGEANDEVLKECCNCLDKSFVDAGYTSSRKVNAIGPLELRVLRRGTFHEILDHFVGLGGSVSQFKTPRCVGPNNNTLLQILCNNVVNCYFSTAFD